MPRSRLIKSVAMILAAGAIVALLIGLIATPGTNQQQGGKRGRFADAQGPTPVLAATAEVADVPVYLDGVATARALNTVTVQPQVDGKIQSINFREGQDVKRGDLLATIDPIIYKAQLDQAAAKKVQDEAQLANARRDLERYASLSVAANPKQTDTQRALVAQLEGLVKADQASIDNAAALLGYTQITAPIDGRTGIRLVDEGNLVRASANAAIVTITQIRPISVLFTLPQQQLARVNKAAAAGQLGVEALGSDSSTITDRGVLQVVDNQVDPTTGTVRLKAEFPNRDLQLWPGQFVNVRLLVDTLRQVVVVPTAAIQQGPNGAFVFVIQPDDTVKARTVRVSQQDDRRAVVANGLTASERVVTTGFARLRDGSRIAIAPPNAGPEPSGMPAAVGPEASAEGAPAAQPEAPGKGKGGWRRSQEGGSGEGEKRGRRRDASESK
jgi:membrane fusion protein, multidrug efflux system